MLYNVILKYRANDNSFVKERSHRSNPHPNYYFLASFVHYFLCTYPSARWLVCLTTSSKIYAQLAQTFVVFLLFRNFRSVLVQCQSASWNKRDAERKREFCLKTLAKTCTEKFMRILNPLMPREVCRFCRARLRSREFCSRSLCVSRVLRNFSMSLFPNSMPRGHFCLKASGIKERLRFTERRIISDYIIL